MALRDIRKHAFLFALLAVPYGVSNAVTSTVMPYSLRQAGISVESIGWYYSLGMVPSFCHFLYAPLGDLSLSKSVWLVGLCLLTAALFGGTLLLTPSAHDLVPYLSLILLGQVAATLMMDCIGGLIGAVPAGPPRDRAVGWKMAGGLFGNAAAAALALEFAGRYSPRVVAAVLVLLMVLPAAFVPQGAAPAPGQGGFRALLRDLRQLGGERRFWVAVLLSLSPCCASGLWGLFSALAPDFGATQRDVVLVNGASGAVATAAGSFFGAYLCSRIDRRWAYVACSALFAITGAAMALGPLTRPAYVVGVLCYVFVIGMSLSIFAAIAVDLMAQDDPFSATKYGLFMSLGNFPVIYAGFIDSRFHHAYGVRAVLLADAVQNALGALLLGAVVYLALGRDRQKITAALVT